MNALFKNCFKCTKEKKLSDFYKHKGMSDGRLNKCKECNKKDSKNYISLKIKSLEWRLKERKRCRKKSKENSNKIKRNPKYQNSWNLKNKEKRKAMAILNNYIRTKIMIKPDICTFSFDICNGKIEGHHCNYDKPLDVVWLCNKHHNYIHRKLF